MNELTVQHESPAWRRKKCKIGEHGYADSGLSWQFNTIRNDLSGWGVYAKTMIVSFPYRLQKFPLFLSSSYRLQKFADTDRLRVNRRPIRKDFFPDRYDFVPIVFTSSSCKRGLRTQKRESVHENWERSKVSTIYGEGTNRIHRVHWRDRYKVMRVRVTLNRGFSGLWVRVCFFHHEVSLLLLLWLLLLLLLWRKLTRTESTDRLKTDRMDDTSKTQKENESYGKWEQGASLALRQWGSEHYI